MSPAVAVVAGMLVAGLALGFGVRQASVGLARREGLEPGARRWQVWGPVLTTGALLAIFGWRLGASPRVLLDALWVTVMVHVVFFDLEHRLILDRVLVPSCLAALGLSLVTPGLGWKQALLAGVAAGALLLALALLGSAVLGAEALGMGDVKLGVLMGLVLGLEGVAGAILLGVILAGAVSVLLVVVRLKTMRDTIAYGPYLAAGTLLVLLQHG